MHKNIRTYENFKSMPFGISVEQCFLLFNSMWFQRTVNDASKFVCVCVWMYFGFYLWYEWQNETKLFHVVCTVVEVSYFVYNAMKRWVVCVRVFFSFSSLHLPVKTLWWSLAVLITHMLIILALVTRIKKCIRCMRRRSHAKQSCYDFFYK